MLSKRPGGRLRCRAGGAAGWWNALKRTHFENISATYVFERRARYRSHVGGLARLRCRAGGAAGRLLCRAGSAAGMWRARYRSHVGGLAMPGRNVMLESTSGTYAFEVPRNRKQALTIFWLVPVWSSAADCTARRHTTREINESASVSQLR